MNGYEIISEKGRGAYSTVYKAKKSDSACCELVALKRYPVISTSQGFPLQTLREIQCLKVVKSPNVLAVKDVFTIERPLSINLILDYCKFSLEYILHSGNYPKLPLNYVKMIFKQIINGVHAIHSSKIIHRDLKPANILITNENVIKISDFGISRFQRNDSRYSANVVTLPYRAPEVLTNSKYDNSIDIWSLGCILYELITGDILFFQQSVSEMKQLKYILDITGTDSTYFKQICSEKKIDMISSFTPRMDSILCSVNSISRDGAELIKKMLSLDPKQRPTAKDIFCHRFLADSDLPSDLPPIKTIRIQSIVSVV